MRLLLTLSDGSTIVGAVQGYVGECATIERARQFIERLQRRPVHDIYIKRDWNPITNEHTRLDVMAVDIVSIQEAPTP